MIPFTPMHQAVHGRRFESLADSQADSPEADQWGCCEGLIVESSFRLDDLGGGS